MPMGYGLPAMGDELRAIGCARLAMSDGLWAMVYARSAMRDRLCAISCGRLSMRDRLCAISCVRLALPRLAMGSLLLASESQASVKVHKKGGGARLPLCSRPKPYGLSRGWYGPKRG